MKFLQIGLGSMGKRRIRCLKALGMTDIVAFDPREDRREEAERLYGVRTVADLDVGFATEGLSGVLVSTPPDMHYPFVKRALEAGLHSFCEANVVTEGGDEFLALAREKGIVAAPSATMRFHPLYHHLRRIVLEEQEFGKPLVMTFHLGNYILDWHPWEGLDFYAGRKATGACREMVPFEFEWMQWIFGPVVSVQCTYAKQLDLPTDIDDTYAIVATFENGLIATIVVEVVARHALREGRLVSQQGSIEWSFERGELRHFDAATGAWRMHKAAGRGFNIEEMYVAEIDAWLAACRGEKEWEHTYAYDNEISRILLACERSGTEGVRVRIDEIEL